MLFVPVESEKLKVESGKLWYFQFFKLKIFDIIYAGQEPKCLEKTESTLAMSSRVSTANRGIEST